MVEKCEKAGHEAEEAVGVREVRTFAQTQVLNFFKAELHFGHPQRGGGPFQEMALS